MIILRNLQSRPMTAADFRRITEDLATIVAVGDQLAATAGLLMTKANGRPVVAIHGFEWRLSEGSAQALIRKPEQGLLR